ncbi:hypothetical protein MSPP1_003784 [Malassezia sp. CBS 17886]|nr:hypothetical protein MSPP1_003784 [Malassezia sp. CBS 17886]
MSAVQAAGPPGGSSARHRLWAHDADTAARVPGAVDTQAGALRKTARTQKQRLEAALRYTHTGTPRTVPAPFEADVRQARSALRATYLALLFTCTFTRAAQHVDTMLWNDTTYSVISSFRHHLTGLEKQVAAAPAHKSATGCDGDDVHPPKAARRSARVAEYQRMLSSIHRFLDEERAFWESLAARIVRMFDVDEGRAIVASLGIPLEDDAPAAQKGEGGGAGERGGGAKGHGRQGRGGGARNAAVQHGAPPSPPPAHHGAPCAPLHSQGERRRAARVPGQRQQLLETLQRTLTYVGDLLRYREMHAVAPNNVVWRSRAADEHTYDFTRAVLFYHEAHLLLPDHGNPANQLAVVATLLGDPFGAMYQYYRALCVRTPFDKAQFNLHRLFEKAAHAWMSSPTRDEVLVSWRQAALADTAASRAELPRIGACWPSSDAWLAALVELHGLLALRVELDCAAVLNDALLRNLLTLAESHALRAVDYLRMVVAGMCASWIARLGRDPPAWSATRRPFAVAVAPCAPCARDHQRICASFEQLIVTHVLGILTALLAVNRHELSAALCAHAAAHGRGAEPVLLDVGPVLRRTLPALRIGLNAAPHIGSGASARQACVAHAADTAHISFWSAYTDFANLLRAAYPFSLLPNVGTEASCSGRTPVHVSEDDDLRELGPIRHAMSQGARPRAPQSTRSIRAERAQPCADGDFARVLDVLIDAKVIAESPHAHMRFDDESAAFVNVAQDDKVPRESGPVLGAHARAATGKACWEGDDALLRGKESRAHAPQHARRDAAERAEDAAACDEQLARVDVTLPPLDSMHLDTSEDPIDMAMRAVDSERDASGTNAHDLLLQVLHGTGAKDDTARETCLAGPAAVSEAGPAAMSEARAEAVPEAAQETGQEITSREGGEGWEPGGAGARGDLT